MSVNKRRENSHIYEFGSFRLDPSERILTRQGERILLAPKAFDTLVILVQHQGHVLEKEELIRALWRDTTVEENNLTQQISQLRRALGEGEDASAYIETVSKLGYRFVPEVREFIAPGSETRTSKFAASGAVHEESEIPNDDSDPAPVTNERVDDEPKRTSGWTIPAHERQRERPRPRAKIATIAVFALIVFLAIGHYWVNGSRGRPIDSVAVLPFLNVNNDPNSEYISDGITESLISSFSQLSNLRVMARDTVFSYKGHQVDPRKAGRDLNVGAVVTGRITEQADTLVVEVDLVKVADGQELWGQRYNGKVADLLTVQEHITREVSRNLRLRLSGEEEMRLQKTSTTNPEAYRLYLKGRYFASKATQEDLAKGIGYLHQAIALDPTYALAYDGMAYYYAWTNDLLLGPREAMPKAKEAAKKALELDDELPQAHTEMAMILHQYDWDWAAAEREFRRAIQLDPNYAAAHEWYGYLLVTEGRIDEGIQECKRAVDLDPLSSETNWVLGWMLYLTQKYDPAIEQLHRTIDLDPNYFLAHLVLGVSYAQKGQMTQAIPEIEKARLLGECNQSLGELGHAYALSGKRQEAKQIADRLIGEWRHNHVGAYDIAIIQVGLGDKEQAIAWLERAYDDRAFFMLDLKYEPELDPLRSDPRFQDLLRRMNFPA